MTEFTEDCILAVMCLVAMACFKLLGSGSNLLSIAAVFFFLFALSAWWHAGDGK